MIDTSRRPTSDELLERAARARRLARYVFDKDLAQYIQDRAAAMEAEAKTVTNEHGPDHLADTSAG